MSLINNQQPWWIIFHNRLKHRHLKPLRCDIKYRYFTFAEFVQNIIMLIKVTACHHLSSNFLALQSVYLVSN